jgi:predicted DNA-binding transcriptional regulator YafY
MYSGYRWFADKNEGIVNGNLKLNTVNKKTGVIRPFTFKNVSSINTDDEGQPTSISISNINNAINNKNEVIIYYDGDENTSKGKRNVEVYAYGISMAGNPVIRAYQLSGDSDTIVPEWKLFRIDRVSQWSVLKRRFTTPRPKFNPNGDKSMKSVLNIAKF